MGEYYPDLLRWDAGCDYYRATLRREQFDHMPTLDDCREWVDRLTASVALDSGPIKGLNLLGYTCWSKNGVTMGIHHEHGVLFQLSGGAAYGLWRAIPSAAKPTRIDLQLTAHFQTPEPQLALNEYFAAQKDAQGRAKSTARRLILNSRGGSTLYFGSRQSPRFGRLYDKGMQQKSEDEGVLWRYEIELKEAVAAAMGVQRELTFGDHRSAAAHIAGHFRRWGCWVPPHIDPALWLPPEVSVNQFDLTRRLRWLATQVAPTVRMVESSAAREGLALGILGLKHPYLDGALGGDNPPE